MPKGKKKTFMDTALRKAFLTKCSSRNSQWLFKANTHEFRKQRKKQNKKTNDGV